MDISIIGAGYVGLTTAGCLAETGHKIFCAESDAKKLAKLQAGELPFFEPHLQEMVSRNRAAGLLEFGSTEEAIDRGQAIFICVGTPPLKNGEADLSYIEAVARTIAKRAKGYRLIIEKSTVPVQTGSQLRKSLAQNKNRDFDYDVASNPEFLREGTAIADFHHPPFTLIGSDDEESAAILQRLYAPLDAPVLTVGVKEAEMVKYVCNCFHGLKVAFANEVGALCKAFGIDSHRVMEVFCKDEKLNLSAYYLKPGFAFGGSCLPKDLRALTYQAKTADVDVALLNAILSSNRRHIERGVDMVLRTGKKRIGVLGLSFKAGTDDLRESPMVTLIETLIGKGMQVMIFDREVELARLFGANKTYIEQEIPHISSLMKRRLDEVIEQSEVIVLTKRSDEYRAALEHVSHPPLIIDLARVLETRRSDAGYQGIGW